MSRQDKRRIEREKRKAEQRTTPIEQEATPPSTADDKKERPGAGQYVGEVRSELKRVHWPNRKELVSYTLVVIVAVVLMTTYITGIDEVFSRLVFGIFG